MTRPTAITDDGPYPVPIPATLPSDSSRGRAVTPTATPRQALDHQVTRAMQPGTLYLPPAAASGLQRMAPTAVSPPDGGPPVSRALGAGGRTTGATATPPDARPAGPSDQSPNQDMTAPTEETPNHDRHAGTGAARQRRRARHSG